MVTNSKSFRVFVYLMMTILSLACVLPIILLILASVTDEQTLIMNGYSFIPEKFSTYAYEYIFRAGNTILRAYGITLLVTVVGTTVNVLFTLLLAYPLSRKTLKGRNVISFATVKTQSGITNILCVCCFGNIRKAHSGI